MAVYKRDIVDINLETGNIHRSFLKHSIGYKDQQADHFGIRTYRNGEPVDLTGVSVQGIFMPPQGDPIAITSGNIVDGNVAEVVLPQACYNYDGQFTLSIKLVDATNAVTGTMRIVDGMVDNTHASGTVAPTDAVPTYQEILAVYAQLLEDVTDYESVVATQDAKIDDLKSALDSFSYVENINALPWTQGYIRTDGTNGDDNAACRTNGYLQLQGEVTVTPKNSYRCNLYEYASESISSFVRKVEDSFFAEPKNISVDPSHYYRFVVRKVDGSNITYNTLPADTVVYTERNYTDESLSLEGIPADAKATGDKIEQVKEDTEQKVNNISSQFVFINLFNKETIIEDKYLNTANGQPADLSDYFCSDYIDVSEYESVVLIGTHIVCLYNENKGFTGTPESMDSRYENITLTIPTGCKYIRFSTNDSYIDTAQIGENVSRTDYVPYGYFIMPNLINEEAVITVKPSGGDYSSFTQAVKENLNTGVKIVVYPGEYDIVSEYVAIWGETAVNSMADSSSVFDGFQYGVILRNREIEFMPGARLACNWTGHTVDGSHRFSPIRVDYNVIIKGMNLTCRHTFYAIHDDYGLTNTPFTNEYHDCVVNAENLIQQNVIGGGCKRYSRHIIVNCYFNNGTNSNIHTVRYHNTNQSNAVPEIYVSNTFFNGTFTARWYGTQETKMTVYVNNCKARAIYTMQEAEGYTTENVDLFKWNNEETNPVN